MSKPGPSSWSDLLRHAPRFLLAVPEALLEALSPARMQVLLQRATPSRKRATAALFGIVLVVALAQLLDEPQHRRAAMLVGVVLVLWLSEVVPAFATALVLVVSIPLSLQGFDARFALSPVLGWVADPVLALFFGGFALGTAAQRHGLDAFLARRIVGWSGGSRFLLVALLTGGTALLGMWMSNTASAAMMLAASRPVFNGLAHGDPLRRGVLVGIALGANIGGLSTPIGTPPNGIAVAQAAHLPDGPTITFVQWLLFGAPLVVLLLGGMLLLLRVRYGLSGKTELTLPEARALTPEARSVLLVFALAVAAWVSEPVHGLSTPLVGLAAGTALFGSGLLTREDVGRIDWATLVLVGGSVALGKLMQEAGLLGLLESTLRFERAPEELRLVGLVLVTTVVGSFLSNTATATLMVPLAATIAGTPSGVVLVGIAASLGVPFVFSTPPNAMAYGEGGLRPTDLLVPGLLLVVVGGLLVALTGPWVLQFAGL